MPTYLDLDRWNRREHFHFFRGYDNPYFNLCAPLDVTPLLELCRQDGGASFFLASLYLSQAAANSIAAFRYRLRGERVLVHEVIHGGSTVLRDDDTFSFAYFDYETDFQRFQARGREILERARDPAAPLAPHAGDDDLIHYSVIPWVAFTSFSHARRWGTDESIPKIVFGKHTHDGTARRMPVSVEVHHALMDGLDVGRYFERFQELLADPQLG